MKILNRLIGFLMCALIPAAAMAAEWEWTTDPTPGSKNNLVTENGDGPENYENGTLSKSIILSEVMPNPEGTDNETEWIELYNNGTTNVDLGNWSLDDEEGGSKPYIFPAGTIIEAQDFLVITRADSKLALNNDTDEVRLFDFQGNPQDSVLYNGSPEGQSYARISLEAIAKTKKPLALLIPTAHAQSWVNAPWEWTPDITQGSINPIYHFIAGTITNVIPFEDQIQLQTDTELLTVSLKALTLNPELKKTAFSIGNQIQGYATLKNDVFELKRFENSTQMASPTPFGHSKKIQYLALLITAGIGAIIYRRKLHQN